MRVQLANQTAQLRDLAAAGKRGTSMLAAGM
jgi:hypothetical protein